MLEVKNPRIGFFAIRLDTTTVVLSTGSGMVECSKLLRYGPGSRDGSRLRNSSALYTDIRLHETKVRMGDEREHSGGSMGGGDKRQQRGNSSGEAHVNKRGIWPCFLQRPHFAEDVRASLPEHGHWSG